MQFEIETLYGMTKNIETVLTPLLVISYICGVRIIEFPKGNPRIWFSLLYMLILWSNFYLLLKSVIIHYYTEYFVIMGILIDILITLLSIGFGVYHEKKFKNCLKKLDIVDNTLLNMGTEINYHKLHKKTMYLTLGWLIMTIVMIYGTATVSRIAKDYNVLIATYVISIELYCYVINMINDVIIANILGYIGLKFDQINQHLLDLLRDNKHRTKPVRKILMNKRRPSQASSNEWMTWIIIHLHSELRKISCEIDSIFGAQMTFKMGCNFCWLALDLRGLFGVIFLDNITRYNKTHSAIVILILWISHNIWKLIFFNYACETIGTKANAAGNLMKKMSYSIHDVEIRENISVFLLQISQAPVKFYGIGLFQFGYKFLYGFTSSITTVVVLLIQGVVNKQTF